MTAKTAQNGIQDVVRRTSILEIVGDMIRVRATDTALGDLAEVENVDGATSPARVVGLERQSESFHFVNDLINSEFDFTDRDVARDFFTQVTRLYKNWNYSAPDSSDYARYRDEITELADRHRTRPEPGPSGGSTEPETAASKNQE